jgi:hypothetical protein
MRGLVAGAVLVCLVGCYPDPDDAPFQAHDAGTDLGADMGDVEPDFAPSDNIVFVDATAQSGGTGAETRPFQSMAEALDTEALVIAVAAGSYDVPTEFTFLSRRRIVGVGAETIFTASGPVTWTAARGLELTGMMWTPALTIKGDLAAESVAWSDGLLINGIAISRLEACALTGRGLRVTGGPQLGARGLSIKDVSGTAMRLEVVAAEIIDLAIDGTVADSEGSGDGLDVVGGQITVVGADIRNVELRGVTSMAAVLDLRDVVVSKASAGIWIAGEESTLNGCSVSDTQRTGILLVGAPGRGVFTVRNTTVRAANLAGLQVQNADAVVTKSEFSSTGISGESGNGISLVDSHLEASNCVLDSNETNGLYVVFPSSAVLNKNEYTQNMVWGLLGVCGDGGEMPEIADTNSTFMGNGSGDTANVLCAPP